MTNHLFIWQLWLFRMKKKLGRNQELVLVFHANRENKIWLKKVFEVVKYLAVNKECTKFEELSFGGGLFLNTYRDLLFPDNPKLEAIAKGLPQHGKYTSCEIQNEVVSVS